MRRLSPPIVIVAGWWLLGVAFVGAVWASGILELLCAMFTDLLSLLADTRPDAAARCESGIVWLLAGLVTAGSAIAMGLVALIPKAYRRVRIVVAVISPPLLTWAATLLSG